MRAGKLRHRITIERVTEVPGGTGEPTESWTSFAQVMASVEPLTGRELFDSSQTQQDTPTRFRTRYVPGVKVKDRISWDSRLFDIVSVSSIDERDRELEIMATEHLA